MKSKIKILTLLMTLLFVGLIFTDTASAALVNCGGYDVNGVRQPECDIPNLIQTVVNVINFLNK